MKKAKKQPLKVEAMPYLNMKKHPILRGCFFVFLLMFLAFSAHAEPFSNAPKNQQQLNLTYAPVVAHAAPAVVNVYAKRIVQNRRPSLFNDPFFNDFFGRQSRPRQQLQNSLGSGVLVREDGIVVTNNHVIEGSESLTVVLSDQREFQADVLLADARTDLAVLKLRTEKKTQFPYLIYHDEDEVEVGDLVLAIGNPFGVGQTVTSGIVSGLARTQVGVSDFQSFIQTDAAINPGNSGGALVTMDGRLLGVNTAIFTRSGGSIGIGFAIPANMVRRVVQAALAADGAGRVKRPWLGARLQNVTQELAETLGLARPMGALLLEVHPQSPFAQAGLQSGDVVTAVEKRQINRPEELRYRLAIQEIGATVTIHYLRNGTKMKARVMMREAPENPPRNLYRGHLKNLFFGIELSNINPAVAEEIGLSEGVQGVVVVKGNPKSRLGLQAGDLLLKLNGQDIRKVADAVAKIEENPNRWSLEVKRGNRIIRSTIR